MIYTCVYGSHKVSQNSCKCNMYSHLPAFFLFVTSFSSFCLQTKNTKYLCKYLNSLKHSKDKKRESPPVGKYLYHQYPFGSNNLICTINLTLNLFCALILI